MILGDVWADFGRKVECNLENEKTLSKSKQDWLIILVEHQESKATCGHRETRTAFQNERNEVY